MNRFATVAALALLAGCGLSESTFQTELQKAGCEWAVECFQAYADVDACIADNAIEDAPEGCTYDAKAAKDCLDGVQDLTCDDTLTDYPAACDDVYTCPTDTSDSGM